MERRKFVLGVGALAAGGAAAVGSGAFTSVEANRTVDVDVADDSNAYLTIKGNDTPNGREYVANRATNGTLSLDFSNTNERGGGSGLNQDATTIIRDIFSITNQGTQRVLVRVSNLPEGMSIFADGFDGVNGQYQPDGITLNANTDTSNLPRLDPGDSLDKVGVNFKPVDGGVADALDDFSGDITIEALTNEEAGAPEDEVASG